MARFTDPYQCRRAGIESTINGDDFTAFDVGSSFASGAIGSSSS